MGKIKSRTSLTAFVSVFAVNFILFAVKLYVGLSSNSISIYSDGINNLFDGISAVAGIICFVILSKGSELSFPSRGEKAEQLLSFVLSAVIAVTGIVFLFNSAERLLYPAPVWFSVSYFYIIAATAAVKLILFICLRRQSKKADSSVIGLMSTDSLTDFFITLVTLITLYASQKGGFSFDAYAGIAVSVLILASGIRSFRESVLKLTGSPDVETVRKTEELLSAYITDKSELEFTFGEENRAVLKTDALISQEELETLRKQLKEETDFMLYLLK